MERSYPAKPSVRLCCCNACNIAYAGEGFDGAAAFAGVRMLGVGFTVAGTTPKVCPQGLSDQSVLAEQLADRERVLKESPTLPHCG
jgi:hypothetical protein